MLSKFSSVCTFLSTTIQDHCKRCTLFRVFRGHVVFEGIYFFFCICDNRPWHFLRFVWLNFVLPFSGPYVHRIFLFSRCREQKTFSMPLQEFVVQFKTRNLKNLWLTLKTLLFVFNSSKGDNGFQNIVK